MLDTSTSYHPQAIYNRVLASRNRPQDAFSDVKKSALFQEGFNTQKYPSSVRAQEESLPITSEF